jgi:hypothetical protein
MGHLTIPVRAMVDEELARYLTLEREVPLLPPGSAVMFDVNPDAVPGKLRAYLCEAPGPTWHNQRRFVQVTLGEPLGLLLRGAKRAKLQDCSCVVEAVGEHAVSLSHAYAVVTRHFQPLRRSFGGNVFLHGHYLEGECWLPCDDLRQRHEARLGRIIAFVAIWGAVTELSHPGDLWQPLLFPREPFDIAFAFLLRHEQSFSPLIAAGIARMREEALAALTELTVDAGEQRPEGTSGQGSAGVGSTELRAPLLALLEEAEKPGPSTYQITAFAHLIAGLRRAVTMWPVAADAGLDGMLTIANSILRDCLALARHSRDG